MEKFKRAQVIILPTENIVNAIKGYKDKSLLFKYQSNYKSIPAEVKYVSYFHLYIISDDEIKESACILSESNIITYAGKNFTAHDRFKKIIATTDTSLTIDCTINKNKFYYLPQPSQQFIERYIESYNRGVILSDVLVEYEDYFLKNEEEYIHSSGAKGNYSTHESKLKVNPKDNTITIKCAKDSWSREEVIEILIKCCGEVSCEDGILLGKEPHELYEWINKNL